MRSRLRRAWKRTAEELQFRLESDARVVRRAHERNVGRPPNLRSPRTFNEKVLWLNLHATDPRRTLCADKHAVRAWVAQRIGEEYLVPLLGVHESADEIDFDSLPDRFVIKATHGSRWVVLVPEKAELDVERVRRRLGQWLTRDYYRQFRERHYRDIPPRLIIEEMLLDERGRVPNDYKILCMRNGDQQHLIVQVDTDRFTHHERCYYDPEWLRLPLHKADLPVSPAEFPRPERLDEMLRIARTLSAAFAFVRVDLYSFADRVYFGELTFTPDAGTSRFHPPEWDLKLGEMIGLPERD